MADRSDAAVDLVIVGSGAAGLTAAVTGLAQGDSVLVLESSDQIGGTTELSVGMIWAPNTPEARATVPPMQTPVTRRPTGGERAGRDLCARGQCAAHG